MKELTTNNKNVEQIYSDYSLDELLQFIKEQLEQSKEYEQEKNKNFVLNLIMPIFQRHNRYNSILIQLCIIKNNIKEIEAFHLSQRLIIEQKIEIEKFSKEINTMKALIESFKIPSMIIVKRKILDLIIFSLMKSNKDKFDLDKCYCPNKNFLEKLLEKLEKKNVLRKDEI